MTSKASFSNHAMRNLYFWTIRKNALIIGIASVLCLIFRPGLLVAKYAQAQSPMNMQPYVYHDYYTAISQGHLLTALIAVGLILLLFALNFHYLHNKSESDLFHSLPISRARLMLTRFSATLTGVLIPILLSGIAEVITAAVFQTNSELTPIGSLYSTAMMLVVSFAASAMVLLFCVIVGNTLDLILSLLIVNGGWMAAILIAQYICSRFLFGFIDKLDGASTLLPFVRLIRLYDEQAWLYRTGSLTGSIITFFAYWLIFGAVMLCLAIPLIKKRKNEAAGRPYAYSFIRYLIMAVVSMLTGYFFGYVFGRNDLDSPAFYLFFAVGALLGAIIYGAIATRGFIKIYKLLLTAGVCCVLFGGIIGAAKYDLFGYNTRVPSADAVECVRVTMSQSNLDIEIGPKAPFTSPEAIESVLAMHKTVIEGYVEKKLDFDSEPGYLTLEYELSFGRKMERHYSFATTNLPAFKNLITSAEYIEATDPFLQYEAQHGAESFDFAWVNVEEYNKDFVVNANTVYRLVDCGQDYLEAHKKDLAARTGETFSTKVLYVLKLYKGEYGMNEFPEVTLNIYQSDTNMLELLKKQQVIYYAGDGMWFFRTHDGEHVITHQILAEPEPEEQDPAPTYTPTDGVDPLLDFEAQGGSIADYSHVQLDIVDSRQMQDIKPGRIRSSHYGLGERIADAYRQDIEMLGDAYENQAALYSIRFVNGATADADTSPITLYITDSCSNTICLLEAEGLIAALAGEDFSGVTWIGE